MICGFILTVQSENRQYRDTLRTLIARSSTERREATIFSRSVRIYYDVSRGGNRETLLLFTF